MESPLRAVAGALTAENVGTSLSLDPATTWKLTSETPSGPCEEPTNVLAWKNTVYVPFGAVAGTVQPAR